jgi:hypothetical protein
MGKCLEIFGGDPGIGKSNSPQRHRGTEARRKARDQVAGGLGWGTRQNELCLAEPSAQGSLQPPQVHDQTGCDKQVHRYYQRWEKWRISGSGQSDQ